MQAKRSTEVDEPMHPVLVTDLWKYPLLTVSLVITTLIPAFAWQKYWPKCRQKIADWMQ